MNRIQPHYEFGRFRVDVADRALLRDGDRVPLTRKAFATLCVLLERAGETVTKRELMDQIWPDTIVGEATLSQNIYTVRRALEAGSEKDAIETRPGLGYCFAAPVREAAAPVAGRRSDVRSVAVLPFRAMESNASHQHLGVCLADALITRLSRLPDLLVRPSSAIFRYVDREFDPVTVGRQLEVDAVLVGTLLATEQRIRANVQLVDVRVNAPLWADRFDVPFPDILTAEEEITDQVLATISIPGGPDGRAIVIPGTRVNEEAYRAYVRGRYFWNQRTPEGLDRAMESFRYALAVEPEYAKARAGLADCYALYPILADVPPREAIPQAQEEALRALALDAGIAEPHVSLAYTRFLYDWEWEEAEAGFLRGLQIDPNYATAHHWFAMLLAARNRPEEAVASARLALRLDPESRVIHADLALIHYFAGLTDEAVRECERTLALEPSFAYGHFVHGLALGEAGRAEEAVEAGRRAVEMSGGSTPALALLGYEFARAGHEEEARDVLKELTRRAETEFVPAARFAMVRTGLGEMEGALDGWFAAAEERSRFVPFLPVWPLGPIREEPRFQKLLGDIGPAAGHTPLGDA